MFLPDFELYRQSFAALLSTILDCGLNSNVDDFPKSAIPMRLINWLSSLRLSEITLTIVMFLVWSDIPMRKQLHRFGQIVTFPDISFCANYTVAFHDPVCQP